MPWLKYHGLNARMGAPIIVPVQNLPPGTLTACCGKAPGRAIRLFVTPSAPDRSFRIELTDEAATRRLAARLAGLARNGDLLALRGDLGSGKTSFARAFIRACGDPEEEVPSPTFTLVQTYETPVGTLWHFDLYRLSGPDEVGELGFDEALAGGIVLAEWPERLGAVKPDGLLDIDLFCPPGGEEEARIATLRAAGSWIARLEKEFGT